MQITFKNIIFFLGLSSWQVVFSMQKPSLRRTNTITWQVPDEAELFEGDQHDLSNLKQRPLTQKQLQDPRVQEHLAFHAQLPGQVPLCPLIETQGKKLCSLPLAPKATKRLLNNDEVTKRAAICLQVIKKSKIDEYQDRFFIQHLGCNVWVEDYLARTSDLQVRQALRHIYPDDLNAIYTCVNAYLQNDLDVESLKIEIVSLSDVEYDDEQAIESLSIDDIVKFLCQKLRNDKQFKVPKMGQARKDYVIRYLRISHDPQLQQIWNKFKTIEYAQQFDLLVSNFINEFYNPSH